MLVLTRKETFRVDSEDEGQRFIEEEKEKADFISKSSERLFSPQVSGIICAQKRGHDVGFTK